MCQNVSEKLLITRPKFKVNFQVVLGFLFKESNKIHSHYKDDRPRDIGHKMSMVLDIIKSSFDSQ